MTNEKHPGSGKAGEGRRERLVKTESFAACLSVAGTHSKLPLDGLHQFLVCQMGVLSSRLDLLWQFVLVPGKKKKKKRETRE